TTLFRSLEAPGNLDLGEPAAHVLHRDRQLYRAERADRRGGVAQLYLSAQRRIGEPASASAGTPVRPLPRFGDKSEIASDQQLLGLIFQNRARRIGLGDHRRSPGAKDSRLLAADVLARRAQIVDMV